MAEELVLTTPVVETKTTDKYKIVSITFDTETIAEINITGAPGKPGLCLIKLRDNNGAPFSHSYVGDQAMGFIKFVNTGDFTVNSMNKRTLQKLSNDGILPGTVTGTPD